jgi:hypothetical protein
MAITSILLLLKSPTITTPTLNLTPASSGGLSLSPSFNAASYTSNVTSSLPSSSGTSKSPTLNLSPSSSGGLSLSPSFTNAILSGTVNTQPVSMGHSQSSSPLISIPTGGTNLSNLITMPKTSDTIFDNTTRTDMAKAPSGSQSFFNLLTPGKKLPVSENIPNVNNNPWLTFLGNINKLPVSQNITKTTTTTNPWAGLLPKPTHKSSSYVPPPYVPATVHNNSGTHSSGGTTTDQNLVNNILQENIVQDQLKYFKPTPIPTTGDPFRIKGFFPGQERTGGQLLRGSEGWGITNKMADYAGDWANKKFGTQVASNQSKGISSMLKGNIKGL